jgi:hypothetical protein
MALLVLSEKSIIAIPIFNWSFPFREINIIVSGGYISTLSSKFVSTMI